METNARYTIVGLFTIAVAAAGFIFVFWLNGFADRDVQARYRVRFETPVIGLRPGVAVLFNGLHVGQVTSVRFDPEEPKILMADIAVAPGTPIRQDTRVGIDAQGLVGSATVSLTGGSSTELLPPGIDGKPPLLIASATDSESLTRAAKVALAQLDTILADNAKPLHTTIDNLSTFSDVLARNSGRIEGILAGLENMTGGGAPKPPPLSYNLSAPNFPALPEPPSKAMSLQLAVPEPTALVAYESQKVLVSPKTDELQPLEQGQWADSVPKLVQAKMVESLEKAGFQHAAKTTDGFTSEAQLLLEIRSFAVSLEQPPVARIEIGAKLLGSDGKIVAERSFNASAPSEKTDSPAAAAALNAAFQTVMRDIVGWTETAM
jgi:phospholipid/cholesterol/gamma-HCH transport system substrate-binding protein